MMKIGLCILLCLLLTLVLCGGVVAGPNHPNYGDPDIVEGMRPRDGASQLQLCCSLGTRLVVDMPLVGRVCVNWEEQIEQLRKMAERLPAALKKDRNRH